MVRKNYIMIRKISIKTFLITVAALLVISLALILAASYFEKKIEQNGSVERKSNVVIVLSQCRSGSSIVGEIFNRRKHVSYMYEPLFPFRREDYMPNPARLSDAAVTALRDLATCRFDRLPQLYRNALDSTGQHDQWGNCLDNRFCFPDQSILLGPHRHAAPDRVREVCWHGDFVAMKVNGLRRLELLAPLLRTALYDHVTTLVKVVHVVRDPRATVASMLRVPGNTTRNDRAYRSAKIRQLSAAICQRLAVNSFYADERFSPENRALFYLRVRHEDFCLRPIEVAQRIYQFIHHDMTTELIAWLTKATSAKNAKALSRTQHAGTTRNARHVVSAWRTELTPDDVRLIEEDPRCREAMDRLGYKFLTSESQLKDFNISTF